MKLEVLDQITSSPFAIRRSHKCDPMNPAPPVTRILMIRLGDLGVRSRGVERFRTQRSDR